MPTQFADWPQAKFSKIAIIGYTPHRAFAPFKDPDWLCVGLNDLYLDIPNFAGTVVPDTRWAWFQLHSWTNLTAQHGQPEQAAFWLNAEGPACPRDRNHVNFLSKTMSQQMPVFLMDERPEVPNAVTLPKEDIREYFGYPRHGTAYITNTISWMIGWALMHLAPNHEAKKGAQLGIFGVDMAVGAGSHAGNEYGYQRPSCEFFLGWANALLGPENVIIPDESDLLATAFEYGDEQGNRYRRKQQQLRTWYSGQRGQLDSQIQQLTIARADVSGRLAMLDHNNANYMPGDHGQWTGGAPAPLSDVVATVPDFEKQELAQATHQPMPVVPIQVPSDSRPDLANMTLVEDRMAGKGSKAT